MFILMHVGGMPFNGDTIPKGESLGGSESAAYYMAKEFKKMGHEVYVFTESTKSGMWDGVTYEFVGEKLDIAPLGDRFNFSARVPFDVCIIQRHPIAFTSYINSKINIWWLHDLALFRNLSFVQQHLFNLDQTITVSEFHRKQVSEVYGIPKEMITPSWNGVDYDEYQGLDEFEREEKSLIFASRPERGLENLVSGDDCIMKSLPDYKLYVCSYSNTQPGMAGMYEHLWSCCRELPNVELIGHMGKRELAEKMGHCKLYVYPTMFEDTSCMMALEAFASGLPFLGFRTGALPETTMDGGAVLIPHNGEVDKKKFVKEVKRIFHGDKWSSLHRKALSKEQTWESAAEQWIELFEDLLEKKVEDKFRLSSHLERMSDIVAMTKVDNTPGGITESLKKNYYFYFEDKYLDHYTKYYEYEKSRGVEYGPEDLDGQPRYEAVCTMIDKFKPKKILDFGCAHGHYVMNLARRYKDIEFLGMDLVESNIRIAQDWKNQVRDETGKEPSVRFFTGDENEINKSLNVQWDMILACEVLEHHPDPALLVEVLKSHLMPDGVMCITVPYGPWEAIGYKDHPGWRAHIHHLERGDLFDMFRDQEDYKLMGVPQPRMAEYGFLICTFKNGPEPIKGINYERKLSQQAPQETLSVCVIVKDGEYSLGRTLRSIENIADEIIIGIDENTKDDTARIAEAFGAESFIVKSPVETGFDEARNETIKRAKMDWILWIDTDETFENAEKLRKYLRPNCFMGYAIKQHHYAIEPPALMKTDIPVRMFRNREGIKFFGIVHEHPEKKFGDGVGKVYMIDDVAIMHTGYSTEEIRKKRFYRNFPLMKKDRQKYPDRKLGKFLWLRDLAHLIRYTLEKNGMNITDDIIEWAKVIIFIWRELLEMGELRMVVESMPWYSEAVNIATFGKGIRYRINIDAVKGNGREIRDDIVEGVFVNREDISNLTEAIVEKKTEHYEEKYF